MKQFKFLSPQEIQFGAGTIKTVGEACQSLKITSALLVSDPFLVSEGHIAAVTKHLERCQISYSFYSEFESSPTLSQVENAAEIMKREGHDGVIGFGGGSSLDVAKAITILNGNPGPVSKYIGIEKVPQKGCPLILIPTTAGTGSEVSDACILKDDETHIKGGIRSKCIMSDIALLDPELTVSMPSKLTASTGMDALTHAIEGYASNNASVLTRLYHLEAIRLITSSLRSAVANGNNMEARENVMLGSLYAGWAMAVSSLGACHAMAYPIEANYNAPHGDVCAALLPAVMRFNVLGDMEGFKEMAVAMGQPVAGLSLRDAAYKAVEAVELLAQDLNLATLGDIGVLAEEIAELGQTASENERLMSFNPRPMRAGDCAKVYQDAL